MPPAGMGAQAIHHLVNKHGVRIHFVELAGAPQLGQERKCLLGMPERSRQPADALFRHCSFCLRIPSITHMDVGCEEAPKMLFEEL
eukprot:scaffold438_cov250-Pinguiococcus_pyrenoidosus.AAC.27